MQYISLTTVESMNNYWHSKSTDTHGSFVAILSYVIVRKGLYCTISLHKYILMFLINKVDTQNKDAELVYIV